MKLQRSLACFGILAFIGFLAFYGADRPTLSRRLLQILARVESPLNFQEQDKSESFRKWMANAGLDVSEDDPFRAVCHKLVKRVLMFLFDVLPDHEVSEYIAELTEPGHFGLHSNRVLTESEQFIKEELARGHLESLATVNSPYKYFTFVPEFKGRAIPSNAALTWDTPCWKQVSASVTKVSDGWELQVHVSGAKKLVCSDFYLFATATDFHLGLLPAPIGGTKKYLFKSSGLKDADVWDIEELGVRMFRFPDSPLATVKGILETALLFTPVLTKGVGPLAAARNIDFLKKYRGITMKKRHDSRTIALNESYIHSGDFLGVIRLDGLDPMLAFGMGSHTGHTTVALWEEGELYVAESTANGSYWPVNGIQRTPFRKWLSLAEAAGYSVVHAPLAPKYRDMFNAAAANEAFHNIEGTDYGYGAMLTGWIDTEKQNYPCMPPYDGSAGVKACLTWPLIEVLFPLIAKFVPAAEQIFLPAWNQHVTGNPAAGLSPTEVYQAASKKNIKPSQIFPIVEKDGTLYPNNFNNGTKGMTSPMVCDVFVCNMWKAGGLFEEISNDFNCVEQTNSDIYNLPILEAPQHRPQACIDADPENALCQLMGEYSLELPLLGTRPIYKHMSEQCPTEPPLYSRPRDC